MRRNVSYHIERTATSGAPLVTLADAKRYLKVGYSAEDELIKELIEQVTDDIEGFAWRSLLASTYKVYTNCLLPSVILARGPVDTISSVQYYDENNELQTLSSSYYFLAKGVPDQVCKAKDVTYPTIYRRQDAVIVTYTTSPTPDRKVKSRVLKGVGYLFENRSNLEMRMDEVYRSIVAGMRRNYFV